MRVLPLLLPAALLAASACVEPIDAPNQNLGLVTIRAFSNSGTPVVRGSARFFSVAAINLPAAVPTECQFAALVVEGSAQPPTLNAGPAITFSVAGSNADADRLLIDGESLYEMADAVVLPFSVGDTASVTIPGALNGFPSTSLRVRLAEPFTAGPFPTYTDGQPMNFTWSASTTPGSVMLASLKYSTLVGGTVPNAEIACLFEDLGTGTVPASFASIWALAEPASRSVSLARIRETILLVDQLTRVRVRSFYEVPTPTIVAP